MRGVNERSAHLNATPSPLSCCWNVLDGADVIGVGEDAHGDTVSWPWRMAIVGRLLDEGFNLDILCENMDVYVDTRRHGITPNYLRGGKRFYPNMLPRSDTTRWHLDMTRAFMALPRSRVRFFGTDVQQLSFDFARLAMRAPVRRAFEERDIHRRWLRSSSRSRSGGALRNRLNAEVIARFAESAKVRPHKTKILYFAHNEHVSTGCVQSRKDPTYVTEGAWMRRLFPHLRYVAIATTSFRLWNVWDSDKPRLRKGIKYTQEDGASGHRDVIIVSDCGDTAASNTRLIVDMENYTSRDFDCTIVQKDSERPV